LTDVTESAATVSRSLLLHSRWSVRHDTLNDMRLKRKCYARSACFIMGGTEALARRRPDLEGGAQSYDSCTFPCIVTSLISYPVSVACVGLQGSSIHLIYKGFCAANSYPYLIGQRLGHWVGLGSITSISWQAEQQAGFYNSDSSQLSGRVIPITCCQVEPSMHRMRSLGWSFSVSGIQI
jgi:hypothetical protein